ncbi:hypothetical protein MMC24_003133 [Lignoscripta atroalba]|nr:hypothetical protein [Lignoscripta atroalba]
MSLAVYPLTTPDLRDYPDEKSYFRAFRAFGEPVPPYRTYNSDSDDSDNQDGGLPSPTPSLDREWEHFQERKRNFIQDIREQNARYEARLARQGIYMRTRSGILKNQYELGGWDLDFCILDTQGKLDFVESIDDHIRRKREPQASVAEHDGPLSKGRKPEDGAILKTRKGIGKRPNRISKIKRDSISKTGVASERELRMRKRRQCKRR